MTRILRALPALILCAGVAAAQPPGDGGLQGGRQAPAAPAQRAQMVQRLQQGLWRIAKTRIGLSDAQMTQLAAVNKRYDARRRTINQEERAQRQLLRAAVGANDTTNQGRLAIALDSVVQLQRQRLDLVAEEQKELAGFMTPLQRAKFGALQEQLRRRVQALQQQRENQRRGAAPSSGQVPG
jgi:hypothetical protein